MGNFQRLRNLFEQSVDLSPRERARLLDEECEGDSSLRSDLEALLSEHDRPGTLFDTGEGTLDGILTAPRRQPTLQPGTRLGSYEIVAPLGAGGMADVYRATDVRLERTVALKVLPPHLSRDPSAVLRFGREARVVAALSHPHICPVYDVGQHEQTHFLVMECLEGETLAERLSRGRMGVHEACRYGGQIAQALAAAHRAGIVHRDLKPGNVMVTPDGLRLLDFGLSKRRPAVPLPRADAAPQPPITRQGILLGTLDYMAPEQLEGRDADERTDVFAFGVVLYEMLTGRRPFQAASDAGLIGQILHSAPPPPLSLVPTVPRAVDALVLACMAKDPADRPHDFDDVAARLATVPRRQRIASEGATRPAGVVAGVLIVAAIAGVAWRERDRARTPQAPRGSVAVDHTLTRLTFDAGLQTDPAFSPDGRFIAYAGDASGSFDIWVQPLSGGEPVQLTRSPSQETEPAWSPDGTMIAFHSDRDDGGICLVPALGGPERRVSSFGRFPSWSADSSQIRFLHGGGIDLLGGSPRGIYSVPARGGPVVELLPEFSHRGVWLWIAPHPDGRISYFGQPGGGEMGFYTVSNTGAVTRSRQDAGAHLIRMANDRQRFRWSPDGSALFVESFAGNVRNIWKVRINRTSLAWKSAEPMTVGTNTAVAAAVSADGSRVAFSSEQETERLWSFPFASEEMRVGEGRPVSEDGAAAGQLNASRDGSSILYTLSRMGSGAGDGWSNNGGGLWVAPLDPGGRAPRLLAPDGEHGVWSRDGRRVAYLRVRPESTDSSTNFPVSALAARTLDGPEELISPWDSKRMLLPFDWSPDDRALLVSLMEPHSVQFGLWPVAGGSGSGQTILSANDAALWEGQYSPDGRWLAFVSVSRTGTSVNVVPAGRPAASEWLRVSPSGRWGDKPRWSPDGRRLYFLLRKEGLLNLWCVAFHPDREHPIGDPVQITHFESPRFMISPRLDFTGISVAPQHVAMTMRTATGNIWMIANVNR